MTHLLTAERLKWGIIIGSSVVVGDYLIRAAWRCYKKRQCTPDALSPLWKKVGEVSDLICYPIKSGGWIRLDEFDCNPIGVGIGRMRDRTFMFVNENFNFVTARKYPKLIHIMPEFDQDIMTLSAPDMKKIEVDFKTLLKSELIDAEVWDEKVKVHDAGDDVAEWVSKFILNENSGIRLVYFASNVPTRDVREKNKVFETAIPKDTGATHDATSYMLINEASIEELNSRIEKPVAPLWFRPNIVVRGPKAFEEDSWKFIKFGDRTIFKNVKPCTRCIFTTIDPATAEKDPKEEPLKTLKTYRKAEKCGDSPVMGIHLGVRELGNIKVGDAVYIINN